MAKLNDKTYWQKLEDIGWLKYLPADMHEEVREQLRTNLSRPETQWAFLALTQAGFDSECIDDENSYVKILKDLAKDSRGVFAPTNIKAECKKKTIKISFDHRGKSYSCQVPFESDWFEFSVLDLMNKALEESKAEERFILLPAADQLANIVILPPAVYEKAVKEGLIPEADALSEYDD